MKFRDIKMLTSEGSYQVNIPLDYLDDAIKRYQHEYELQLCPNFQRGHVWTEEQRIAFVEFFLRGGMTSRIIYLNRPYWGDFSERKGVYCEMVLVDGLQRLTSLLMFVRGELPAFGHYVLPTGSTRPIGEAAHKFFEDGVGHSRVNNNLLININNLQSRKAVLQWYLEMNAGGTPHTEAELDKVRIMIAEEK